MSKMGLVVFVANEEIIYVPTNGHLLTVNHFCWQRRDQMG
jgi:hypothetical protein